MPWMIASASGFQSWAILVSVVALLLTMIGGLWTVYTRLNTLLFDHERRITALERNGGSKR